MTPASPDPLLAVIAELQQLDTEINCGLQAFFDAGVRVWIGDDLNGRAVEQIFAVTDLDQVVPWLRAEATRLRRAR
jgi:hypothetical protein